MSCLHTVDTACAPKIKLNKPTILFVTKTQIQKKEIQTYQRQKQSLKTWLTKVPRAQRAAIVRDIK